MCALPSYTSTHRSTLSHTHTHLLTTLALFANFLSVFGLFVCLFAHFMLSYARINNKKQKAHKVYTYMQTNVSGFMCVCVCVCCTQNVCMGKLLVPTQNSSMAAIFN